MNTDKIYAEAVANEYAQKSATKVVQLKKLDRAARRPANLFAWIFGTVTILVAGVGMCLCLGALGDGGAAMMALGIALGTLGFIGAGVNYPAYKTILAKGKEQYAGDIIRLADEIIAEAE